MFWIKCTSQHLVIKKESFPTRFKLEEVTEILTSMRNGNFIVLFYRLVEYLGYYHRLSNQKKTPVLWFSLEIFAHKLVLRFCPANQINLTILLRLFAQNFNHITVSFSLKSLKYRTLFYVTMNSMSTAFFFVPEKERTSLDKVFGIIF